jgi:hypothetical protein
MSDVKTTPSASPFDPEDGNQLLFEVVIKLMSRNGILEAQARQCHVVDTRHLVMSDVVRLLHEQGAIWEDICTMFGFDRDTFMFQFARDSTIEKRSSPR